MENKSSIKLNSFLLTLLSASAVLISLISYPYVTRVLSPAGLGDITFARSVISYFTLFAELGMPVYGMRACARAREDKKELGNVVSELLSINITTHVIVSFILALSVYAIPKLRETWPLFLALGFAMLVEAINPIWLFRGIEKYVVITAMSIGGKIFTLIALFIFVKNENDTFIYACIIAICSIAAALANFIYMKIELPSIPKLKRPRIAVHLKPVLVFFLMSCATTIYVNMDVVMLKFLKTKVEVGYYDVGLKVKTILNSISASLWTVTLPRATSHWQSGDKKEAENFVKKSLHAIYAIQFPFVFFFIFFSAPTVMILGGKGYVDAITPMIFILLSVIAIGTGNVISGEVLIGNGKEKIVLISNLVGLAINLVLNYFLITYYSVIGAAIATLITETIVTGIQLFYTITGMKISLWRFRDFAVPFLATALGIASSVWVTWLIENSLLQLIIGGSLFGIVYLITNLILKDQIICDLWKSILSIIKKIFKRN